LSPSRRRVAVCRRRPVAVGRRVAVGRGAASQRLSSSVGPAVALSDPVIEVEDDFEDAAPSTVAVASSDPLDAVVLPGPGPVRRPRLVSSVGPAVSLPAYPSPAEFYRLLLNHGITKLYHFTDRSSLQFRRSF